MPKIPRQRHDLEPPILPAKFFHDPRRIIPATIIHHDRFPILFQPIHSRRQPPPKLGQILLLVEDWDDDGDHWEVILPPPAGLAKTSALLQLSPQPFKIQP